ncbi:MAG: hypothetical protein HDS64_08750 [Bacteroidales bacterium]|nr:hypothetical protein [Bacteroidales bacterium]MBD5293368.1 hypothetical protein [Bacteroides sp.]
MLKKICCLAVMAASVAVTAGAQTANGAERRKQALQGTYLVAPGGFVISPDDVYRYGKYVISGNTVSEYNWDADSKTWKLNFKAPFKLIYRRNADYMTGYNIVYKNAQGHEMQMCTGDVNDDGIMDLWCSDSLYYTKQSPTKKIDCRHDNQS